MKIFLDESGCSNKLVPLSLTRHVSDIRVGILTISQKWQLLTHAEIITDKNLITADAIAVDANIIPCKENFEVILKAAKDKLPLFESDDIKIIHYPWNIFQLNDWALRQDYGLLTYQRASNKLSNSNGCTNENNIFIEDGVKAEYCIFNATAGPVYIDKGAEIMEGTCIRGPFYLGQNSVVKMGAKIYGSTSIGPNCVVGGEIKNTVIFANSNKAHDGYLGDSVLGEWCNLGAGSSNSNVKNTGGQVKYLVTQSDCIAAGNKAGLIMGDYSRCAINTSFNTGTIVGVCCNIFTDKMPSRRVENFSWGHERYIFEKALADISNWKKMKQQQLTQTEIDILQNIYSTNQ